MEREGRRRKMQALNGIEELKKCVDTLILISTDKLRDQYGDLKLSEAFHKADDVLGTAAKGIAEIITVPGYVNVDFEDVTTVMKDSGKAIMGSGVAEGEGRAEKAIRTAIHSPLLNDSNIEGAKNILLYITSGTDEVSLDEVDEILEIAQTACGNNSDIIWGNGTDESLGEAISVTLIATGFNHEPRPNVLANKPVQNNEVKNEVKKTVHTLGGEVKEEQPAEPIVPEVTPKPVVDETPSEPAPMAQPLNEERVIHNLFDPEENFEEPVDEEPLIVESAPIYTPEPEPTYATTREEEKPVVRIFDNPFHQGNDDEGFEITSRIMTHEEVTAKAAQEVAVLEAKKAKETDPKEELRKQRLRALSMNYRTTHGLEALENQPAYLRRDVDISSQTENDLSHYSASESGISGQNSFLHDNVD